MVICKFLRRRLSRILVFHLRGIWCGCLWCSCSHRSFLLLCKDGIDWHLRVLRLEGLVLLWFHFILTNFEFVCFSHRLFQEESLSHFLKREDQQSQPQQLKEDLNLSSIESSLQELLVKELCSGLQLQLRLQAEAFLTQAGVFPMQVNFESTLLVFKQRLLLMPYLHEK